MKQANLPVVHGHGFVTSRVVRSLALVVRLLLFLRNRIGLRPARRTRVVVVSGNHILLVRNIPFVHTWSLPGGGIDQGESGKECCQRELRQELGIESVANDYKFLTTVTEKIGNVTITHDCYQFNYPSTAPLRINMELAEAAWYRRDDLPKDLASWLQTVIDKLV